MEEPRRKRDMIELDDEKSKKGLGEVYAEDYVAARTGAGAEGECGGRDRA